MVEDTRKEICDGTGQHEKRWQRQGPAAPSHLAGVDRAHGVGAPAHGHVCQVGDVARQLVHDQLVNGADNLHGVDEHTQNLGWLELVSSLGLLGIPHFGHPCTSILYSR